MKEVKSLFQSRTFWAGALSIVASLAPIGARALEGENINISEILVAILGTTGGSGAIAGRVMAKSQVFTPGFMPGSNIEDLIDSNESEPPIGELHGFTIKARYTTWLKPGIKQSSSYRTEDMLKLVPGEDRKVSAWYRVDKGHIQVVIDGRRRYAFIEHIELYNATGQLVPIGEDDDVNQAGYKQLPDGSFVSMEHSVIPGGHFFWYEVTQRDSRRWPTTMPQLVAIRNIAERMETVRTQLGNRPIVVTSWYRPDSPIDINAAVGGVPGSRHTKGDAIDFVVSGMSAREAQATLAYWPKEIGGMGAYETFTHLDLGNKRDW